MRKLLSSFLAVFIVLCLNAQDAKYIFLIFGDGLGYHALKITEDYKRYLRENPSEAALMPFENLDIDSKHLNFRSFPYIGMCDTEAADRSVTGSSEAATALFGGVKSNGGYVGVDPDGKPVESMFVTLHKKGYQVGIMSTDPINHATPAAIYSHTSSRSAWKDITRQLPASGFEFFSGDYFVEPDNIFKGLSAAQYMEKNGYKVFYGTKEFENSDKKGKKVMLFNECNRSKSSTITAETDINKNYVLQHEAGTNTLAQQLRCCLDVLNTAKPFIVLCEEGEIDHSAHTNHARSVVHHVLRLEEAAAVALEFYKKHPEETLIVVFSDHETGAPVPCGKPQIDWAMLDKDWYSGRDLDSYTRDECSALSKKAGIRWVRSGHTDGYTPIFAIGKGAERFNASIDNTEFSSRLLGR